MVIDPFRFARAAEEIETVICIKPDGRLQGIITANCNVTLKLEGSKDEQNGRFMLEGNIQGEVCVDCQVCLEQMKLPLDIEFTLYPVENEEQAERLSHEKEPVIAEDGKLDLSELVKGELVLSLPATFNHFEVEGKHCVDSDYFTAGNIKEAIDKAKKESPFAVLKSIKQQDS